MYAAQSGREPYFDFLRGVAIIMVIGIHTYHDTLAHFGLLFRQFLNCAVPIFLAISGYFIGRKSFDAQGSYAKFLRKQVARVYIPMLIWSLPWALLSVRAGADVLPTFLWTLVGGMSVFYFVTLIIQYYALSPVIQCVDKCYGGVRSADCNIRHIYF